MKYNPLVKYTINENATCRLTNLVILFPPFHQKEFNALKIKKLEGKKRSATSCIK